MMGISTFLAIRLVVPENPLLAGPVVIGRHDQSRIRAKLLRGGGKGDGRFGIVRAGSCNDRHSSGRDLDASPNDADALMPREGGRFAGRAAGNQPVDAFADLPFDQE